MKNKIFLGFTTMMCLIASTVFGDMNTQIWYEATDLGSERWEYTYDVANIGLAGGIEEFTIYFDYGSYDNLSVSTPATPPDWDQIVWQVEPVLEDAGGYDALATNIELAIGENLTGFSVSFDWLGIGQPGPQYYEIIDPATFGTIESGYTVPEPASCLLLLSGGMLLRRKKR